jgi:hypothetical protein
MVVFALVQRGVPLLLGFGVLLDRAFALGHGVVEPVHVLLDRRDGALELVARAGDLVGRLQHELNAALRCVGDGLDPLDRVREHILDGRPRAHDGLRALDHARRKADDRDGAVFDLVNHVRDELGLITSEGFLQDVLDAQNRLAEDRRLYDADLNLLDEVVPPDLRLLHLVGDALDLLTHALLHVAEPLKDDAADRFDLTGFGQLVGRLADLLGELRLGFGEIDLAGDELKRPHATGEQRVVHPLHRFVEIQAFGLRQRIRALADGVQLIGRQLHAGGEILVLHLHQLDVFDLAVRAFAKLHQRVVTEVGALGEMVEGLLNVSRLRPLDHDVLDSVNGELGALLHHLKALGEQLERSLAGEDTCGHLGDAAAELLDAGEYLLQSWRELIVQLDRACQDADAYVGHDYRLRLRASSSSAFAMIACCIAMNFRSAADGRAGSSDVGLAFSLSPK